MESNIILSIVAVVIAIVPLFRYPYIRNAEKIALQRDISTNSSMSKLNDFLIADNNRIECKRYFIEVPIIVFMYRSSVILSFLTIILTLLQVVFGLIEKDTASTLINCSLLIIVLFLLATSVLAKEKEKEKE